MDNKLQVYTKSATLTTATHKYKMPAEIGNDVKRFYEVMTHNEASSLAIAVLCAKVRREKSYRDIVDEIGNEVCPTFGDFAEKILDASKAYASLHASVGEVFEDEIATGKTLWRYSQLEELLKLRKKTDTEGNPLTGADILEIAETSGITPKSTIREIRDFIDIILHPAPASSVIEDGDNTDEGDGEDTDEGDGEDTGDDEVESPLETVNELIMRLRVYATDKVSEGMINKLYGYMTKMYS